MLYVPPSYIIILSKIYYLNTLFVSYHLGAGTGLNKIVTYIYHDRRKLILLLIYFDFTSKIYLLSLGNCLLHLLWKV